MSVSVPVWIVWTVSVLGAMTWWTAFRLLQMEEEYSLPPVRPWTFYWWERLGMAAVLIVGTVLWPLALLYLCVSSPFRGD